MKKKGFTLVELLAVIAILAILVIVAMPNVIDMFNQAKLNTFVTEVQKIMDTSISHFTRDSLQNSGKTVYYSSVDNSDLNTKKLDISGGDKNYFIEMDRWGNFKRIVVYDANFCYDVYSEGGNGNIDGTKSKKLGEKIDKTLIVADDVWNSGEDSIDVTIEGEGYKVNGCQGLLTVQGKASNDLDHNTDDGDETEPEVNDVYTFGDYKYTYKKVTLDSVDYYGWEVAINTSVTDKNQSSYGYILESIDGKPVISLKNTFKNCVNLTEAPIIPDSILTMYATFYGCTNLTKPPVIPSGVKTLYQTFYNCSAMNTVPSIPYGVTNMTGTFYGCTGITSAPVIPASVTNLSSTFYGCTGLTQAPTIPASVTSMASTFRGCTGLTKAPTIPENVLNISGAFMGCTGLTEGPVIPDSVIYMQQTFANCTNLKTVHTIPEGVVVLNGVFQNCTSLTGKIKINVSRVQQASLPFQNVDFETQRLTLEGTSSYIDTFGNTGVNYCDVCNGMCHHDHGVITYTFTIGGREFQFEKNMTWADWINSSYNTNGEFYFNVQVGNAVCGSNGRIRSPEGSQVGAGRQIKEAEAYIYSWE